MVKMVVITVKMVILQQNRLLLNAGERSEKEQIIIYSETEKLTLSEILCVTAHI